MCLTVANAMTVEQHHNPAAPGRLGWTDTTHHICRIEPGDQFRPDTGHPHYVTEIHHHQDRLELVDQYGNAHTYPCAAQIPTAVADPLPRLTWKNIPNKERSNLPTSLRFM